MDPSLSLSQNLPSAAKKLPKVAKPLAGASGARLEFTPLGRKLLPRPIGSPSHMILSLSSQSRLADVSQTSPKYINMPRYLWMTNHAKPSNYIT